jgi:two-component system, chemotaxis family, sensor kinase Cph1
MPDRPAPRGQRLASNHPQRFDSLSEMDLPTVLSLQPPGSMIERSILPTQPGAKAAHPAKQCAGTFSLTGPIAPEIGSPLPETIDITDCDRELIHIPGSIQPHGVMLVTDAPSLVIRHGAGDVGGMLAVGRWIGRHASELLGAEIAGRAGAVVQSSMQRAFVGSIGTPEDRPLDVTAHAVDDTIIFELEPRDRPVASANDLLSRLEIASSAFDAAKSMIELCEVAAREFRSLTGYDRVMVYRFAADGPGVVLAEDSSDGRHAFLNHHFPASDIPLQARALYVRNLLRVIPDIDYVPAALIPAWTRNAALDMSDSILRSVSPIHLQYLRNMGVKASASVSIVRDGALWGLIACHNFVPRKIHYDVRAACRTLASSLARQISSREETEAYRDRLRLRNAADEVIAVMTRFGTLSDEIPNHLPELSRLMDSDGFAVVRGTSITMVGQCPSEIEVRGLADWLLERTLDTVYATHHLDQAYPAANEYESVAGVLGLLLSPQDRWLLIWFRAEQMQVVNWAGNPHKATRVSPGETLSPRASFDAWQEIVRGRSRPWTLVEVETATRLRRDLIELRQNQNLKDLNWKLIESVAEKESLLDQKKFLIGEINHRVQNSLQLVSSFLSLQAKESADPAFDAAVTEARRRIAAVSLLYRGLYRGDEIGVTDCGRYLRELVDNLIGSMGDEWRSQFHLNLGPVQMPLDRVIPLGLIVTELVININKYAYDGAAGPIDITLSEDRLRFRLAVADRGKWRASQRPGFGTRMMKALVSQLGSELTFEDGAPGLRVLVIGPIG